MGRVGKGGAGDGKGRETTWSSRRGSGGPKGGIGGLEGGSGGKGRETTGGSRGSGGGAKGGIGGLKGVVEDGLREAMVEERVFLSKNDVEALTMAFHHLQQQIGPNSSEGCHLDQ